MKVSIIGAGFGGLSAAALMAKKGYDVTVFEKNDQIGGRARVHRDKGFQFDMGPSWYLMPDVFEDFYKKLDTKPEEHFELKRLDPSYRIHFGADKVLDVRANVEDNYELFDGLEENGGEKLESYLKEAERKYNTSMDGLIFKDFSSISDFFNFKLLRSGSKLDIFKNLDKLVTDHFESDEARKILEYSIGFLGGSPKITPAIYQLMSYVDFIKGVWFPIGGIRIVADSIREIAEDNGAEFKLNHEVEKIFVNGGKADALKTNKGNYPTDLVIVNGDYPYTELNLLEKKYRTYDQGYWDKRQFAPSAFVAYVGIDKQIDDLLHHTMYLDRDWAKNFDEIFESEAPHWPKTPSYYVNVPSKTDPGLAPDGCETLFILVPLAPGLEDTWEDRERFYNQIMSDLEKKVGENIRDHVITKRIFAVDDFRNDYNAYKGTALSLVHTLKQTAMWRPRHHSKKVDNLYYTGQYTHPGIGVPMTLISSQIVADKVDEKFDGGLKYEDIET